MNNKGIWLIIAIVVIFIVASGNFVKIPYVAVYNGGEINVNNNCDFSTQTFTEGAEEGQCYVRADDRPAYVKSVVESQRTGPSGLTDFCKIDTCYSCEDIFKCPYASKYDGTQVKICKLDSECTSNKCVNNLCKEGMPSGECSVNQFRCADDTHYEQCLYSNYEGHWSGKLSCPDGTLCKAGTCTSPGGTRACDPTTCHNEGVECGDMGDECGNVINCGTCSDGKVCTNKKCVLPNANNPPVEKKEFDWNTKTIGNLPLWGLLAIIAGIFLMIILVRKK